MEEGTYLLTGFDGTIHLDPGMLGLTVVADRESDAVRLRRLVGKRVRIERFYELYVVSCANHTTSPLTKAAAEEKAAWLNHAGYCKSPHVIQPYTEETA